MTEKSDAQHALEEALREVNKLHDAIRAHRDSWLAGDDKCWRDNEALYKLLPEGFTPPARDSLCEIENCYKYVRSCHSPNVTYVSPQRRIEELEKELAKLYQIIGMLPTWEQDCITDFMAGDRPLGGYG